MHEHYQPRWRRKRQYRKTDHPVFHVPAYIISSTCAYIRKTYTYLKIIVRAAHPHTRIIYTSIYTVCSFIWSIMERVIMPTLRDVIDCACVFYFHELRVGTISIILLFDNCKQTNRRKMRETTKGKWTKFIRAMTRINYPMREP